MKQDSEKFRHWKTEWNIDAVLRIILDRADRDVNSLSREVLDELDRLLDDIPGLHPSGIILCSGKKKGFIAGADVTEFSEVSDSTEALKYVQRVHKILDRLEQVPVPTVCVMDGFCLGGGLELALACRYRIAVQGPETRLGFPEVKLGIHPGFGGTVRLIRRVGPLAGLRLMLGGKSIDAKQALRIGLVDYVVPHRQWMRAARTVLKHPPHAGTRRFSDRILSLGLSRKILARYLRRQVSRRVSPEQYPAPYAIIDLWERFGNDRETMYREERQSVSRLITGSNARNLVRVFRLQERIRSSGRQSGHPFRAVHVIGAGIMGADIAAWCALQGFRVTLQDVDHQRLAGAVKRASTLFQKKLKESRLVESALDRFIPDIRGEGVGQADVVIEAIFEDVSAKSELYRQVEPNMRRDALLATNTSSIPLENLSRSLQYPGRFVGLHFFNPVSKMQLVEVVRSEIVDEEAFNRAVRFVAGIRRLPLPVSSSPGFLVNRILTPYLLEAVLLEQEGLAAEDIDKEAVNFGMPMGPISLADTVGLDICLSVGKILSGPLNLQLPQRLENLVEAGKLGKKSGEGFYRYKNGKKVKHGKKKREPIGEDVVDRLILRLLNEAVACRREQIVSDRNLLDAGAVFGIGFAPFRGGPVHFIRSEGIDPLLDRLRELEARYGKRFAPDPGWHDLRMQEPGQI
ncbi:MAG: 3-hydroxyacyl-CoA dehydrogenase NAD-binding domain-containing protein [Acidobacteriota bacterium]